MGKGETGGSIAVKAEVEFSACDGIDSDRAGGVGEDDNDEIGID